MGATQQVLLMLGPTAAGGVSLTKTVTGLSALSNGNRTFTYNPIGSNFAAAYVRSVVALTGKRYWEFVNDGPTQRGVHIGVIEQAEFTAASGTEYPNNIYGESFWGICNGNFFGMTVGLMTNGTASSNSAYDFAVGDVIGVAVDYDAGKVWFAKNNVWISGDPAVGTLPTFSGLAATLDPFVTFYNASPAVMQVTGNFTTGQFAYAAPSGFSPL